MDSVAMDAERHCRDELTARARRLRTRERRPAVVVESRIDGETKK
jgi:hypothetical protein